MNQDSWTYRYVNDYFIHRLKHDGKTIFTLLHRKTIESDTQTVNSYTPVKSFDCLIEAEEHLKTLL